MRTPKFITFTGVDNRTLMSDLEFLNAKYPVEFGVLFSASRQGIDPRYPSRNTINTFMRSSVIERKAAHVCGDYAKNIMNDGSCLILEMLTWFNRIQVNHTKPEFEKLIKFSSLLPMATVIGQCRSGFPDRDINEAVIDEDFDITFNTQVQWLYDASGGRGIVPDAWPKHPGRMVGYAGGINSENVLGILNAIDADGDYWIDMESGVRTNDWLDINKCEEVCRKVYA